MFKKAVAVLAMGIAVAVLGEIIITSSQAITDFTSFYCAGAVVRQHGDPYRAAPLGACEQHLMSEGIYGVKGVVMPAPLPPYALTPFAALAVFPYGVAITLWRLILLAAVAATTLALRAMTRLPWPVIVLALVMIDLIDDALPGQPVPLVVAAIALGAWALARGADRIAGALASVTMLEPHVGLPTCLALLAYRPATRIPLLAGAVVAALLSVTVVPASLSVEYLTAVLPQHAAAEVPWFLQYSLTQALHALGASDAVALAAGSLSYLIMVMLAFVLAPRVAAKLNEPAFIIALPPALAVFAGSFIHVAQVACAIPAALMLAGQADRRVARLGAAACVLLVISGIQFGFGPSAFVVVTAGVAAGLGMMLFRPPALAGASIAMGVFALWLALHGLRPIKGVSSMPPPQHDPIATELAEGSWSRFVRAEDPGLSEHRLELLAKAPTWAGLALICSAGIMAACTSTAKAS